MHAFVHMVSLPTSSIIHTLFQLNKLWQTFPNRNLWTYDKLISNRTALCLSSEWENPLNHDIDLILGDMYTAFKRHKYIKKVMQFSKYNPGTILQAKRPDMHAVRHPKISIHMNNRKNSPGSGNRRRWLLCDNLSRRKLCWRLCVTDQWIKQCWTKLYYVKMCI